MEASHFLAFLPETVLILGALALFVACLGDSGILWARPVSLATAVASILAAVISSGQEATLFDGAFRSDGFSQWLKVVILIGYGLVLLLSGGLHDVRDEIHAEYHLFLASSVLGLCLLVSTTEMITLLVCLELASFPLYMLVPMRRERPAQKSQMESAMKYMMFGIAANGVMLFGMSYLFGLTGTTSLPEMMPRLAPQLGSPLAIAGLLLTFAGLYYKLAIFPFHFWTPDVYQGAANETAGLIASLPKLGAVAVLVRFATLAGPDSRGVAGVLAVLAVLSMFYGNLIALVQTDLKRLLGFSGIAHAGYALMGFVASDGPGYTASLFYITSYVLMVLACFVVICRVSPDGTNLPIQGLAGLHRRSPLLAVTLVVGVFALAGLPPFAGFMGKLALLKSALARGYLWLVVLAVLNSAVAVYYYLSVVRAACFGELGENVAPIRVDVGTRILCVILILGILGLGIAPAGLFDTISSSVARIMPASGKAAMADSLARPAMYVSGQR
ncbi:MAG: NADH-quinone oxidoreductase subunit N [Verrucomicrobiales bacterium]|nr:NADH-quinone oxidoreductase subunit N [Verrucomicrobiales bacterium]